MSTTGTVTPVTEFPNLPPAVAEVNPQVGSPLWWVYRLEHRLINEQRGWVERNADGHLVHREGMAKLKRYYEGDHDLPFVKDKEVAHVYRTMLERSESNFMRLVVDVAAERLSVQGLRQPGKDEIADEEAWKAWQRNDMAAWFPTAARYALTQRRCHFIVWPDDDGLAKITLEDPQQTITEPVPGDPSRIAAGLKLWEDDWDGVRKANLYLPDRTYKFSWTNRGAGLGWYEREPSVPNPYGIVPMFPLMNCPDLYGRGASRIEDVIDHQDRINQTLLNMQIAEYLSAFRQKWATGLELPEDENGEPIEAYKAAIDRLWVSPDEKSKFGEFEAADPEFYVQSIELNLQHISILTRTPRHVFQVQGQAPSGDAMKSDEAGLVADVTGAIQPSFGASIRRMFGFVALIEGRANDELAEVIWGDPEWQTYGELVDGTIKLVQTQVVSRRWAREKIGLSPAAIKRVEAEILEDALLLATIMPQQQPAQGGNGAPSGNAAAFS